MRHLAPGVCIDAYYGADGFLLGRGTDTWTDPKTRVFVPFQGRILAEYYGGSTLGTLFDHPEELGSLSTATDYATSHSAERLFYPFGEVWTGSDLYSLGMHQTFGKLPDYDNDSNSDLYNTLNRHYTPMGRWLSPDPGGLKVVKFDDPQTWNMYAYVRNNPTTLTDPSGLIGYGFWWYLKRAARLLEPPLLPRLQSLVQLPPPPPSLVQPPPGTPKWQYRQTSGDTDLKAGAVTVFHAGRGYAGHGQGLNNPASEHEAGENAGPPPKGSWTIGPMEDYTIQSGPNRGKLLRNAMVITPGEDVDMTGRGPVFLIHGPRDPSQQNDSTGCIVLPLPERAPVGTSGIHDLEVVQ
jgi:RHS repeat-associated protein